MNRPNFLKLIAIVFIGLILSTVVGVLVFAVPYVSGWEIGTSCNSVTINSVAMFPDKSNSDFINGSYLNSRGGYLKLGDPASDIYGVYSGNEELFGPSGIYLDVNSPYPVIRDAFGDEFYKTVDGDPYRTYEKKATDSDTWYLYDHYVYLFAVEMETNGVAERVSSYIYGTCEGLPRYLDAKDHTAQVRVFSEFGLSPWEISDGQIIKVNESARVQVSDIFYGIMSSSVYEVTADYVVPALAAVGYDFFWGGKADPHKAYTGAALAMWYADETTKSFAGYGDSEGEVTEGVVKSVPNTIPKSVLIETSADLEAGLGAHEGSKYLISDWTVLNNKVRYLVRVDAVYSAGLTLLSGDQDPPRDTVEHQPSDDVKNAWELLGEKIDTVFDKVGSGLSGFINSLIMPLIVIAVIVVSVTILCLFGGRRQ